ncbi:TPA: hypothetical protein ACJEU7_002402 [Acinetobacter baumannii]
MPVSMYKSETPLFFVMNCTYYWGGENKIPVLIKTNINLEALLLNDIGGYISLVEDKMLNFFNFGSYSGDVSITNIMGYQKSDLVDGLSFQEVFYKAIEAQGSELNAQFNRSFQIEINSELPSSFDSFHPIGEEIFNIMSDFTQHYELFI